MFIVSRNVEVGQASCVYLSRIVELNKAGETSSRVLCESAASDPWHCALFIDIIYHLRASKLAAERFSECALSIFIVQLAIHID